MSDKLDELIENEVSVDLEKRKFMSKFGKYAAVGAGMATLMTPAFSKCGNYDCQRGKKFQGAQGPRSQGLRAKGPKGPRGPRG